MNESNRFYLSIIAALIIILISCVGFMGCTENQTDENNQNNGEGASEFISALSAYNQVKSEIKNWGSNAQIARIHHFGTSEYREDAKETSWEFYVESAEGDKSTDFTYTVGSGITKTVDTSYGTGRNTCPPEDIKIDSTDATTTALNAIKTEVFSDFDGGCKAELFVNENGTPYWEITANNQRKNGHIDLDKPGQYGYAEINAKTGEIISLSGDTS